MRVLRYFPSGRTERGLTLVELLAGLAVAAILIALATPSFKATIAKNRTSAGARDLRVALQDARSTAATRGLNAAICASADQTSCSGAWNAGAITFLDTNSNGALDSGEEILKVHGALGSSITITPTPTTSVVRFNTRGYVTTGVAVAFKFCHSDNVALYAREVSVSGSGNVRLSKDTDNNVVHNGSAGGNLTCP